MTRAKLTTNLAQVRVKKGLTQAELAAQSGVSYGTVSTAEKTGYLSDRSADLLAKALGTTAKKIREG